MKRRRTLSIALAGTMLLVGLSAWFHVRSGNSEPMVRGKSLSEWCQPGSAEYSERVRAVREIGTNALPWLLSWMESQDTAEDLERRRFNAMQPVIQLPAHSATEMKLRAVNGFYLLGSGAAPAISELTRRLNRRDADFGFYAHCLAACGDEGLSALWPVFEASTAREQCEILQAVGTACDRWEREMTSMDRFSGVAWLARALKVNHPKVLERSLHHLSDRTHLAPEILEACRPFLDSDRLEVQQRAERLFEIHESGEEQAE